MSAVQQGVQSHQYTSELQAERYAREQLAKEVADLKLQARKATYERDLTGLLGQGYQLNLVKEMERGEKWAYAADRCAEQLQCIRENYARPTDGDTSPVLLYSHEGSDVVKLPSRQAPADPEGVSYKTLREAQKYAAKHGCTFEQAIEKLKTA